MTQPGSLGNIVPGDRNGAARVAADMNRKIKELEGGQVGNAMTIDGLPGLTVKGGGSVTIKEGGGLSVIDPSTGTTIFEATSQGQFSDGSGRVQGSTTFRRANGGSAALVLADLGVTPGHPFAQALQWFDSAAHIVVADDANGDGLALPYIPIPFCDANLAGPVAITGGTFGDVCLGASYRINPRVLANILVGSDAVGTTGEVRLLANGTQVGATITVAANTVAFAFIGPATIPGSYRDYISYTLQARRTAGAGNIRGRVIAAFGYQG